MDDTAQSRGPGARSRPPRAPSPRARERSRTRSRGRRRGAGCPGTCGPQLWPGSSAARSWSAGGAPERSRAGRVHIQPPARPPARPTGRPPRGRQGRRPPRPVRRARATPSAPGGGLREPGLRSAPPLDHLHPGPRRPRRVPRPGGPRLTSVRARPLCPGPGRGAGGPCRGEGERRESRSRAARPAGWIPSLPQLRAASPTQGHSRPRSPHPQPAPPCHSPGAHTPPAPLAPACTHAADHASLGFVSAHMHVLTQIPSLHPPSRAPFPPYFLEESPIQLPHFARLPGTNLLPFPSKPPPLPPTLSPKLPTAIQTPVTTRWRSKRIVLSYPGKRTLRPQHRLQRRDASPGRR